MNFKNPTTFLKFRRSLVIPPSPLHLWKSLKQLQNCASLQNWKLSKSVLMIGIFKILFKSGAVDAIEYDCLIHNVYGK